MSEQVSHTSVVVAPEREIAHNLAIRTLAVAPLMLLVGAVFWGWAGLISSGFGLAIVAVNFLLGAAVITWAVKISLTVLLASVLFGFILRLGVITAAVYPFRGANWFAVAPFAIALLVTHLGLLAWETRRVKYLL